MIHVGAPRRFVAIEPLIGGALPQAALLLLFLPKRNQALMIFADSVSSMRKLIALCSAVVESSGSVVVGSCVDGCRNYAPRRARQVAQGFPYGNQYEAHH